MMRNESIFNNKQLNPYTANLTVPRKAILGIILVVALFAFEIFNFDTTRYALQNLLGDVNFWGLRWASILAIAFCAIDFAGLARLFTPERGAEEPKAVWYLMGAWFLGATMNALMTWWAISLTLLSHDFGNEVLSRAQLLEIVPIFVATLVWLTRILFIGAFSVAGEHIFDLAGTSESQSAPAQSRRTAVRDQPTSQRQQPKRAPVTPPQPTIVNRRIRQRPPMPNHRPNRAPVGMHAKSRRQ